MLNVVSSKQESINEAANYVFATIDAMGYSYLRKARRADTIVE